MLYSNFFKLLNLQNQMLNQTLYFCLITESFRVYFLYDLKPEMEKDTKKELYFMISSCEEKLEKLGCETVDEFKSGIAIGNC